MTLSRRWMILVTIEGFLRKMKTSPTPSTLMFSSTQVFSSLEANPSSL